MMLLLASLVHAGPTEALDAYQRGERLTARRLAEDVLRADPDSLVGHYIVAEVTWREEGNLPRALYHFKAADTVYQRKRDTLADGAASVHCKVLGDMMWVAEDMENSALFYRTMDRYNDGCTPKRTAEKGWRLMKDGRVDEARQVALEGLASEDGWQRALGGNVLCALEANVRDRAAAVTACEAVITRSREAGYDLTVEAYNASTTTLAALDFNRTEEHLLLATEGRIGGSTNPWRMKAEFDLQRGRGTDAVKSLEQMQRWRHAQEPTTRADNRAAADAALAQVLLAAGETEEGLRVIDRALLRPDRRSATTATADTTLASHTMLRLALRRAHAERTAELRATQGFLTRWGGWIRSWIPDLQDTWDRLAVHGVFTDRKRLEGTFIVYHDDGVPLPVWLIGDLVPLLGPGVVQAELDRQRSLEAHAPVHAYYDAFETEVAWHRGQSRTVALARRALDGLPDEEVLLRARVAARGADHAYRRGEADAFPLYERAFTLDPSTFRRLGLRLPAHVVSDGSALGDEVAGLLGKSPRLTWDTSGFLLRANATSVCIATPTGNEIDCVQAPTGDEDVEPAVALVDAWHREAFTVPLQLSRIDMASLDGTTRLDENARRDALRDLLGQP